MVYCTTRDVYVYIYLYCVSVYLTGPWIFCIFFSFLWSIPKFFRTCSDDDLLAPSSMHGWICLVGWMDVYVYFCVKYTSFCARV